MRMIFFCEGCICIQFRFFYLRSTRQSARMSTDVRGQLELMMLTRHEDYQELSSKINLVNRQLNAKIDAINDRFSDLHQKIMTVTNKLNMPTK